MAIWIQFRRLCSHVHSWWCQSVRCSFEDHALSIYCMLLLRRCGRSNAQHHSMWSISLIWVCLDHDQQIWQLNKLEPLPSHVTSRTRISVVQNVTDQSLCFPSLSSLWTTEPCSNPKRKMKSEALLTLDAEWKHVRVQEFSSMFAWSSSFIIALAFLR